MPQPVAEELLILTKTYPSPSARYVETSCVAGMAEDGRDYREILRHYFAGGEVRAVF